jgi:hypothetical protein
LQTGGRLPLFLWIDDRANSRAASADSPSDTSTDALCWHLFDFLIFIPIR